MKKTYLAPDATMFLISPETALLGGSNGENLNMSEYGSRGDAEDDTDDFWG